MTNKHKLFASITTTATGIGIMIGTVVVYTSHATIRPWFMDNRGLIALFGFLMMVTGAVIGTMAVESRK